MDRTDVYWFKAMLCFILGEEVGRGNWFASICFIVGIGYTLGYFLIVISEWGKWKSERNKPALPGKG